MIKPSIPKGTRDFSPTQVAKREYILNTIRTTFETFGFQPIETPSFENSSTLMGKYGEEGDRLIFKILNSGDYFKGLRKDVFTNFKDDFFRLFTEFKTLVEKGEKFDKTEDSLLGDEQKFVSLFRAFIASNKGLFEKRFEDYLSYFDALNSVKSTKKISEKALRYDLTVPFARYVVQHQNEIIFPFKRYQIQPVWRADRPQKGRFREFFQCDADVVGNPSLWQEMDFIQLYDAVFSKLGLQGTVIKINNRKILSGIAEVIGAKDKLIDFTVALDKLDKIGKHGVVKEMLSKGITEQAIEKVELLFDFSGSNLDKLASLEKLLSTSKEGIKGVEELRFIVNSITNIGLTTAVEVDVTLARGLNYYTGAIFEVGVSKGVNIGSIGGGGRYDNLTEIFGLKGISGVGISFGLDRIYLVLEALDLFKAVELPKPKVVFTNFGEQEALYAVRAITELRKQHIKSELYPENVKMKKQMIYANRRKIPFVVIVGSQEMDKKQYTLKDMSSGEQICCSLSELIDRLS